MGGASIHDYKVPFRANANLWGQYDISKSLHEQFNRFKNDITTNRLELVTDDIVFIMAGGNDLLIYPDISKIDQMA